MSSHSTTNRLAAALEFCDALDRVRQQKQAARERRQQEERVAKGLQRREEQFAKEQQSRSRQDHVYIIRASNGYYKIGISVDPNHRLKELRRQAATWAISLEMVHTIASNNAYGLEQSLHKRFAERRVIGEWFLLTAQDIEWLRSC